MRNSQKSILATVLAALAVALFLARFIAISNHFPFYFLWDMDFVTTLDNVLINSGYTPDHLNHPCFGMYLTQVVSEHAAHAVGALSATSLAELGNSLNPAAGMAELTTYLRLHTPFLEIGMVLALWAALWLILRPGRWLGLLFLAALLTQESLAYHASVIRTELYAMFFWSLAVLMLAIGVRARRTRSLDTAMTLAGVFLGLCFLSKIQAFLHLAAFVPLALLAFSLTDRPASPLRTAPDRRGALLFVIIAAVNLALFVVMMLASSAVTIDPKAGGVFTESFGPNPFAGIFLLAAAALAGGQFYFFSKQRTGGLLFRLLNVATLLYSGFLASFFLGFLFYANPGTSIVYILDIFKMVFMREISSQQQYGYIIINPLGFLAYHPILFAIHLGLLLTLLFGWMHKFIAIKTEQLALCGALTLIALAMLWLTVRYFLRDMLWEEVVLTVLNCVYFMIIWRGARRFVPRLRAGALAALALVLLVSTAHAMAMPRRIAMNVTQLGYQVDFWQKGVYKKNHPLYTAMMDQHYTWDQWKVARRVANFAAWNLDAARSVFQNQPVTQRQVGTVSEGFPVWLKDLNTRIAALPEDLREAIVVDSSALPLESKYFSQNQYVEKNSEYLDKFKSAPGPGILSILPRMDYQILLFVQAADFTRLAGTAPRPEMMKITLRRGNESLDLYGLEFKDYTELAASQLSQAYFFVLKRK